MIRTGTAKRARSSAARARPVSVNSRKIVFLGLAIGTGEGLSFVLSLLFGLSIPLSGTQLLWFNIFVMGILGTVLAFERNELGVISRAKFMLIFDRQMARQVLLGAGAIAIVTFSAWFGLLVSGYTVPRARNLVLLLFVCCGIFQALVCRSEKISAFRLPLRNNPALLPGVLTVSVVHGVTMVLPAAEILGVPPVSAEELVRITGLALIILILSEQFKFSVRRHERLGYERSARGTSSEREFRKAG